MLSFTRVDRNGDLSSQNLKFVSRQKKVRGYDSGITIVQNLIDC